MNYEYEIAYFESSCICCGKEKLVDDEIKVYKKCSSGMEYSHTNGRILPELGIIRIQVAG